MEISEKDLYTYIMYPEQLEPEKFEYISSNREDFRSQLDFLIQLKENLNTEVDDNIVSNIVDRIENSSQTNVYELLKIDKFSNNAEYSQVAEPESVYGSVKTYYLEDTELQIQLKIDVYTSKTVLSLYCAFDVEDAELKIKFQPSGKEVNINYDKQPITINEVFEFDKAELIIQ